MNNLSINHKKTFQTQFSFETLNQQKQYNAPVQDEPLFEPFPNYDQQFTLDEAPQKSMNRVKRIREDDNTNSEESKRRKIEVMSIMSVPDDLWLGILNLTKASTIVKFSMTCHKFGNLIKQWMLKDHSTLFFLAEGYEKGIIRKDIFQSRQLFENSVALLTNEASQQIFTEHHSTLDKKFASVAKYISKLPNGPEYKIFVGDKVNFLHSTDTLKKINRILQRTKNANPFLFCQIRKLLDHILKNEDGYSSNSVTIRSNAFNSIFLGIKKTIELNLEEDFLIWIDLMKSLINSTPALLTELEKELCLGACTELLKILEIRLTGLEETLAISSSAENMSMSAPEFEEKMEFAYPEVENKQATTQEIVDQDERANLDLNIVKNFKNEILSLKNMLDSLTAQEPTYFDDDEGFDNF